jgi:hypothetical protein
MKKRGDRPKKLILIFNCNSSGRRAGRARSACFHAFSANGALILKVIFNVNLNMGRAARPVKPRSMRAIQATAASRIPR